MTGADMPNPPPAGEKQYWLDNSRNVDRLIHVFYVACAAVLAIDVFFPKHGPFPVEHLFGFYGFYGFIACAILVRRSEGASSSPSQLGNC